MASIVKRGTGYSVVYRYEDELGQSKQKWKKCCYFSEKNEKNAMYLCQYKSWTKKNEGVKIRDIFL